MNFIFKNVVGLKIVNFIIFRMAKTGHLLLLRRPCRLFQKNRLIRKSGPGSTTPTTLTRLTMPTTTCCTTSFWNGRVVCNISNIKSEKTQNLRPRLRRELSVGASAKKEKQNSYLRVIRIRIDFECRGLRKCLIRRKKKQF
jgi:hypothetical protein